MTAQPISFESGGYTLTGTLTVPTSSPPVAGAVLVSGSGPIDRDSNMKRARLGVMGQVAEHLASQGIASLRYDKRGVGESEGEYKATGFHDNVEDARAAVTALRERREIDPQSVFVVGHSEGALIATELAADDEPPLAGAALLAGAVRPGREILRWQAEQLADSLPTPVKLIMKLLRQDLMKTQEKRFGQLEATTTDVARIQLVKVNAKWFREFMAYDPAGSLRRAAVPILAITGSKDIQANPADVGIMQELVPTEFEGHVLEDVTHLLRSDDGPASTKTYKKQMKRPVDAGLLDAVSSWINSRDRQVSR
jgi:pimeloyl-ACP methyl ester carboxylesterase